MVALIEQGAGRRFALSVVTNKGDQGRSVELRRWAPGQPGPTRSQLDLKWPDNVYSLTHVALPIPPGDALYGGEPSQASPGIRLGNIAMLGERGVLYVSPAAMLRLRWNPFFSWQQEQIIAFMGLEGQAETASR